MVYYSFDWHNKRPASPITVFATIWKGISIFYNNQVWRNFHSRARSYSLCLSVVWASFIFGLGCPSKNRPEDLCALCAFRLGQIHSEIFQGFLVASYLQLFPAVVHVMFSEFPVLTFVLQDMVHNLQYLMGQCHKDSLFAPTCCQSFITLWKIGVLGTTCCPGTLRDYRFRLFVAVVSVRSFLRGLLLPMIRDAPRMGTLPCQLLFPQAGPLPKSCLCPEFDINVRFLPQKSAYGGWFPHPRPLFLPSGSPCCGGWHEVWICDAHRICLQLPMRFLPANEYKAMPGIQDLHCRQLHCL